MKKVLAQMLEAGVTEHIGAERDERTEDRNGYRISSYGGRIT